MKINLSKCQQMVKRFLFSFVLDFRSINYNNNISKEKTDINFDLFFKHIYIFFYFYLKKKERRNIKNLFLFCCIFSLMFLIYSSTTPRI